MGRDRGCAAPSARTGAASERSVPPRHRLFVVAQGAIALAALLEDEAGEIGAEAVAGPPASIPWESRIVAHHLKAARLDRRAVEVAAGQVVEQVDGVDREPLAWAAFCRS